jgi:hypothetical protein
VDKSCCRRYRVSVKRDYSYLTAYYDQSSDHSDQSSRVSGEYTRWSDYSPSTESNGDGDTRVIEILVIESVGKFSPWFPAHSLESGIHADEHFKKFTNFIRHAMPQLNRTGRLISSSLSPMRTAILG